MNKTENVYCRLCAELKPENKLADLQSDDQKRQKIVNNLTHLNLPLDFNNGSILPKTVCFICVDSLKRAYDFVIAIERAQEALNDIILSQPIKKEEDNSDDENFVYEQPDDKYDDDIDIKLKQEEGDTSYKPLTVKKSRGFVKIKKKHDSSGLDVIPLSQLKLTWKDYSWTCGGCETLFPTVAELISHSMQFHNCCNSYRCTDCNKRTSRLNSFLIHVRRHRKYLKLSCHICFKAFSSSHETHKHLATHNTSKYSCNGCNTYFSSNEEFSKHTSTYYKRVRSRNVPTHLLKDDLTCLVCKKKYTTKTTLNTHLLIHTERKRDHTCEVCGKCFLNKQTLAGHLMAHSNIKPYSCEICKTSFRTKNQLSRHIGVHDGEKPFSCEQCGRCFRLQMQLNSHSIIHTDSLPHVCTYCNKGFRFKTILNQHIRQHTGIKPYSCDICQRDFTNWPNYNKHMKRRHNMDMAKKKHTPEGLYPIDPATGKVVYPEMDKMLEWKKKVLEQKKRGRPKLKNENVLECKKIKSEESNNN